MRWIVFERMLALPLAGEATEQDEGGRDREGSLRTAVGGDQQAKALHRGEAPHVQQHGPLGEGAQQVGRVGHRPRLAAGTPTAGALDEELPPQGDAIDRTPIEAPRIEAIGQLYIAVRVELQQLLRPRELRSRWHHKPLAGGRPAAHALGPDLGVDPVHRRPGRDRLEQQEFGPVEMPDHRHIGGDTCSSFVERSEVMQVEDVGGGGTRLAQDPRPGGDQMLVGRVVDGGEDPVGCAGAVLVGRV